MITKTLYFAQVYGTDAYGMGGYACPETNCQTGQNNGIGAPNTGMFNVGPELYIPAILIAAVFFASVVLVIKKIIRKIQSRRM